MCNTLETKSLDPRKNSDLKRLGLHFSTLTKTTLTYSCLRSNYQRRCLHGLYRMTWVKAPCTDSCLLTVEARQPTLETPSHPSCSCLRSSTISSSPFHENLELSSPLSSLIAFEHFLRRTTPKSLSQNRCVLIDRRSKNDEPRGIEPCRPVNSSQLSLSLEYLFTQTGISWCIISSLTTKISTKNNWGNVQISAKDPN